METPHLSANGWTEKGQMVRVELAFPRNIKDLFIELDNSEDEDTNDELGMDNATNEDK